MKRKTFGDQASTPPSKRRLVNSSEAMDTMRALLGKMTDLQQKQFGAILGALVADAATRPTHWEYQPKKLEELKPNPEFASKNHSPYYDLPTGRQSGYGDIIMETLRCLAANPRNFDVEKLMLHFEDVYHDESEYMKCYQKRQGWFDHDVAPNAAIKGPWLHQSVLNFRKNYVKGLRPAGHRNHVESVTFCGFCAALPVVASLSLAKSKLQALTLDVIQMLTIGSVVEEFSLAGCEMVEAAIYDRDPCVSDFVSDGMEYAQSVMENVEDHFKATKRVGIACAYPGSFLTANSILQKHDNYVDAVRSNILTGGCNCCRSTLIGAVLGGKYGIGNEKGIPWEWIKKTDYAAEAFALFWKASLGRMPRSNL